VSGTQADTAAGKRGLQISWEGHVGTHPVSLVSRQAFSVLPPAILPQVPAGK
jgi:hypothetical protein